MATEKNSTTKGKSADLTGGRRRPSQTKPVAAEQTKPAQTKEKIVVTQADLIRQMYSSPIDLVAALCNDNDNMRLFTLDDINILLKPMFINEEVKTNFWSYMNTSLIQARNRLPVGSDAENIRFAFNLIKPASDKTVELTLDIYCMLPEVLANCNNNCVPAAMVAELRKKNADQNQVIAFQLGGTPLIVNMFEGKPILGFSGSFGAAHKNAQTTDRESQFGGVDGEFHKSKMKVTVEETSNGLKDHMAHHEAPPETAEELEQEVEEAQCNLKLGFHPGKGWCIIADDGSLEPLLMLACKDVEFQDRGIFADLQMLKSNIDHVVENLKFRSNRNMHKMHKMIGTIDGMLARVFGDRPQE